MDVQCTFRGESVQLTGFIKGQQVGQFYLVMVNSSGNFIAREVNKMTDLEWVNISDALATSVTAIDGQSL